MCSRFVALSILLLGLVLVATAQDTSDKQQQQQKEQCHDLRLGILARSGLNYGNGTYGRLIDVRGQPIVRLLDPGAYGERLHPETLTARGMWSKDASLADMYSNAPDIPTIAEVSSHVLWFCFTVWRWCLSTAGADDDVACCLWHQGFRQHQALCHLLPTRVPKQWSLDPYNQPIWPCCRICAAFP
jgi:hypothetical protein